MILDRMAATMGVLRDTCGDRVDQARTFLTSSRIGPESHCSGDLVSSAILQIFCKIAEHEPRSTDLRSLRLCKSAAISAKLQILQGMDRACLTKWSLEFCNFADFLQNCRTSASLSRPAELETVQDRGDFCKIANFLQFCKVWILLIRSSGAWSSAILQRICKIADFLQFCRTRALPG